VPATSERNLTPTSIGELSAQAAVVGVAVDGQIVIGAPELVESVTVACADFVISALLVAVTVAVVWPGVIDIGALYNPFISVPGPAKFQVTEVSDAFWTVAVKFCC